jgi:hypothetical protein
VSKKEPCLVLRSIFGTYPADLFADGIKVEIGDSIELGAKLMLVRRETAAPGEGGARWLINGSVQIVET